MVQHVPVELQEQLGEWADPSKRLLKIVSDGIGKMLKFFIRPGQLLRTFDQGLFHPFAVGNIDTRANHAPQGTRLGKEQVAPALYEMGTSIRQHHPVLMAELRSLLLDTLARFEIHLLTILRVDQL